MGITLACCSFAEVAHYAIPISSSLQCISISWCWKSQQNYGCKIKTHLKENYIKNFQSAMLLYRHKGILTKTNINIKEHNRKGHHHDSVARLQSRQCPCECLIVLDCKSRNRLVLLLYNVDECEWSSHFRPCSNQTFSGLSHYFLGSAKKLFESYTFILTCSSNTFTYWHYVHEYFFKIGIRNIFCYTPMAIMPLKLMLQQLSTKNIHVSF